MLAGDEAYYLDQQHQLVQAFASELWGDAIPPEAQLPLRWLSRQVPRKFGNVLPGDIAACRDVAKRCGVLLDPIYTLAAWEHCLTLVNSAEEVRTDGQEGFVDEQVVMLHTGGALGLQGLAQRLPQEFAA